MILQGGITLTCAPKMIVTGFQILGGGGSYIPSSQPTGTQVKKRPSSPSLIRLYRSSGSHPLPPPSPILFLGRLLSSLVIVFRLGPLTILSPISPSLNYLLY